MKKKTRTSVQGGDPAVSLIFKARMERIAEGMNYFGLPVPEKITLALKTRGPVPVFARINGSEEFLCSLYPGGDGRHRMRVRNQVCASVDVGEGDMVRVDIRVRDRSNEQDIPPDVAKVLRAEGVLKDFEALPPGKKSFILRKIEEAARPETRKKRIDEAVTEAHARREKLATRR